MPVCPKCGAKSTKLAAICIKDGMHFIQDRAWSLSQHDPLLGRCLNQRFVLVDGLGSGMMGTVYEAIQIPLQRRVAVKILRRELVHNNTLHRRFKREAEVVSRLNHENLVALYDFDIDKIGVSYIAMEYIDGRILSDFQPFENLNPRLTFHIITQLLYGLSAAHELGIVHRDLKPENVFVCAGYQNPYHVKVLDFGLAKLLENNEQTVLTANGDVFGTPLYMAPEQATGALDITCATDVYTLGVMLYELISGKLPFSAATPLATMMQHVNMPPPLLNIRAGIPNDHRLQGLIGRCLSKDPSRRYQNAQEILEALRELNSLSDLLGVSPSEVVSSSPAQSPQNLQGQRVLSPEEEAEREEWLIEAVAAGLDPHDPELLRDTFVSLPQASQIIILDDE